MKEKLINVIEAVDKAINEEMGRYFSSAKKIRGLELSINLERQAQAMAIQALKPVLNRVRELYPEENININHMLTILQSKGYDDE